MQVEYATDIVFKKQADLQAIYHELIRTAIHTVKPDNIATFLGRKLHGRYEGEMKKNIYSLAPFIQPFRPLYGSRSTAHKNAEGIINVIPLNRGSCLCRSPSVSA